MRNLVCDDIVDDRLGRKDQSPAEGKAGSPRAAPPSAFRIAHADSRHTLADPGGKPTGPMGKLPARRRNKMVAETARQMLGFSSHSDFAVDDRHRRRSGVELATDAVRDPEHRHDRAFSKRQWRMQSAKTGRDPFALGCEKAQALARRYATRQDQFNPAFGGIDSQSDPPGPQTDPYRQWGTQIQRGHLSADIIKDQVSHPL